MTTQERIASLSTPRGRSPRSPRASSPASRPPSTSRARSGSSPSAPGCPVAVVHALVDVLATMELAERIGEHWVAGAELEPAMREPQLGLLRDDLRTTLLQGLALFTAAASSRTRSAAGATPTSSCCRRRGAVGERDPAARPRALPARAGPARPPRQRVRRLPRRRRRCRRRAASRCAGSTRRSGRSAWSPRRRRWPSRGATSRRRA